MVNSQSLTRQKSQKDMCRGCSKSKAAVTLIWSSVFLLLYNVSYLVSHCCIVASSVNVIQWRSLSVGQWMSWKLWHYWTDQAEFPSQWYLWENNLSWTRGDMGLLQPQQCLSWPSVCSDVVANACCLVLHDKIVPRMEDKIESMICFIRFGK